MIDLAIVLVFVAYSVAAGFAARRRAARGLDEYFLAGRSIKGWRAGLSMAATQYAADTPLLVMGLLAVGGAFSLWRLWIYGLAFLLMGFVLGAAWRRARVLTDAELVTIRYSGRGAQALRALKAIYYGTVINCVVLAFVLVAAVRIFEIFLPWHAWLPETVYGLLIDAVRASGLTIAAGVTGVSADVATADNVISISLMLGFVLLYSTTGGLRGVIATDVAQLAFMLGGTLAYAVIAVGEAGGLGAMRNSLDALYGADRAAAFVSFAPAADEAWIPFLVVIGLQWFFQMNSDGTGYLAQRTMACSDDRQARIAAVTFTIAQVVVRSLLWLVIGVALLVLFPFDVTQPVSERFIAERELVFATGIDALLPVGLRGLMLAGMLAALASTIDSHLNWGASYWSNDLYYGLWVKRVRRREAGARELVRVARASNVVILLIALVIMVHLESIQTAWQTSLLFGAGTGAVLVARWLWERVNLYCEIAAIVVSLIVAPVLIVTVDDGWLRLLWMSVISSLAVMLAAYYLPGTDRERLVSFYLRARPPGWWPKTAAAAGLDTGEATRRLQRDLTRLAACAVSVYAWLVGAGKLLVQETPWLSGGLIIAVGFAAMPLWLKALRDPER